MSKKSNSGPKGPADNRNSKNGRFVTEDYARRNKDTTEKEHNRKK